MTIAAALEYAGHRWRVFPVHSIREGRCTCRTACGRDAGKHPRTCNGVKDATTDERIIRKWWTWWPEANVAIATGRASGMWALDVDDEDAHAREYAWRVSPRAGGRISIFPQSGAGYARGRCFASLTSSLAAFRSRLSARVFADFSRASRRRSRRLGKSVRATRRHPFFGSA